MRIYSVCMLCSLIIISSTASDTGVQPIVALVGDDVILPCTLRHTVSAVHQSVEWQRPDLNPKEVHLYRDEKDDLVLQNPVFRGRTSLFKEELENGNTSLKLTRVKLSDAGNYTCYIPLLDHQKTIIQLLVGESTHLLTTQTPLRDRSHEIKGAVSRPVIIIERMEGDEVVLRCEAEGCYPEPVMEWFDAQGRVLPAAGPTETSRDREGCYTVTSHVIVPNSDNNTFTCRVQQLEIKHMKERQVHVPDQMFPRTCHSCWLTVLVAVLGAVLVEAVAVAGGLLYLLIKKGILTFRKEAWTSEMNKETTKNEEDEANESQSVIGLDVKLSILIVLCVI
ncbi:butyrophilin subfamily 1 member A1 isoform X2 [Oncorhynchus mykiss]|uniref:butyrophilin subfamily 1 member A1 isoform X2 n=1 Tax=Oncorhynchus mykiss TaxID=8022 RepID=UPI00187776C0|nr:butyrophilin subfamily 1 member A1 isoform X2 [Oncorhynchus mykiss]